MSKLSNVTDRRMIFATTLSGSVLTKTYCKPHYIPRTAYREFCASIGQHTNGSLCAIERFRKPNFSFDLVKTGPNQVEKSFDTQSEISYSKQKYDHPFQYRENLRFNTGSHTPCGFGAMDAFFLMTSFETILANFLVLLKGRDRGLVAWRCSLSICAIPHGLPLPNAWSLVTPWPKPLAQAYMWPCTCWSKKIHRQPRWSEASICPSQT